MVWRRALIALRSVLLATALFPVFSEQSSAGGVGGGQPFNAAAVAEFEQAEAEFIAQQLARQVAAEISSNEARDPALNNLLNTSSPYTREPWSSTQYFIEPNGKISYIVPSTNPATGIPTDVYEPPDQSAAIAAAAQEFVAWVNSIPNKAGFTPDSLAASWQSFLNNLGIHQNVPVPGAATAAVSAAGGGHLGMYLTSSTPTLDEWGASGGGSVITGKGYRITDTAGLLAPGTTGPSFRAVDGNGGIYGSVDASRFFGMSLNQSLMLYGYFNYNQYNVSLGAAPGAAPLVVGNAGSLHGDTYTLGGEADYRSGTAYFRGLAEYNFGHTNEADGITGGTGGFNTSGYHFDAKVGQTFVLFNSMGSPTSNALVTKAPPKPTGSSGTLVGVDLSGHVGYYNSQSDGFIDSTGFAYGTGQTQFEVVGGRAELFEYFFGYGLLWKPYVAATVDQLFGFSSALNIPVQATVAGGDLANLQADKTFGGAELGINASGLAGWTIGVKGFYQASADTNIAGGSITLKIPFNYLHTAASRY